jgi:CheY-like chemotaxis protein
MIPQTLPLGETPRILVVEDEVLLRSVVADELRESGCDVTEVGCAEDALAYLEAGGQVDLVFSDVRLSGRANGVELARQLRQLDADLPIFLTSATATPEEARGEWRFIPKPYNIPNVILMLFDALGIQPFERRA